MKALVPSMQELLEAGVHFGHKVSRGNPKMQRYIYGVRDGVHIIDLAKSESELKIAVNYVYNLGKEGKVLLVVGTKKQAREIVESLAKEAGAAYITSRWVAGLLTNFDEIKKNLNKLTQLKKEQESGELKRYTKREQLLTARKIEKFEKELGGVAGLETLPDAIFIVDASTEDTAVREARRVEIPLVGFADTNVDPNVFDYPIPANDDGIKAIRIVCEAVIKAYGEGKKEESRVKNQESREVKVEEETSTALSEETEVLEEEIEKEVLDESKSKVE
ncbi:MAG: 30S ribosomal protein S2 [Candidatus Daviesbacteria bacterium GW2011_GWA2_38_24]|uniref:Small ribosomal subunit protein uS2 n=1 Tax=Candidatus Daviesbacteria bacterium GW2011_GWA2_38_24 TaxID=1618422 RepID=A0A0G0JSC5_9BACT|nr:MAG: 30S ribosomal protein S2 [Candidatus Daviesbacteria bacterium GW2011_GWA2_38_24]KKQ80986.1 MAG: 30S ribosomal protein S2 [Candidatus Daviesbacteria bacterium GW2011_GWA1_38_7]